VLAEIFEIEQPAEQAAGPRSHQDLVRTGKLLQTRSQIGRFADQAKSMSLSDQIADDHQARGDSDADVDVLPSRHRHGSNRSQDLQCGVDCALGVVFVRRREAEIGEHAVSHQAKDMAVVAPNGVAAAVLELVKNCSQVFRVEPRRQRGRADHVAEQHGQMPSLGPDTCGAWREGHIAAVSRRLWPRPTRVRNCFDQFLAVFGRDAELLEVPIVEAPEGLRINVATCEKVRVLAEAKVVQPSLQTRHLPRTRKPPSLTKSAMLSAVLEDFVFCRV
jgi:hypothetical protein